MKKIAIFSLLGVVVILGIYQALVYFDNNFKYGRMRETPAIRPYEEPILIMEKGLVPVNGGEAVFRTIRAEELTSPLSRNDTRIIKSGQTLYFTYCSQCHGKFHDGNGTVGQSFSPLPGDLRSAKVQSLPEGVIFQEISYGIAGGRQPALSTTISVLNRWRIVSYLKSLGPRT